MARIGDEPFHLRTDGTEHLDGEIDERGLNKALEDLIRTCPTQYLWSYNRYKTPRGAAPVVEDGSKA